MSSPAELAKRAIDRWGTELSSSDLEFWKELHVLITDLIQAERDRADKLAKIADDLEKAESLYRYMHDTAPDGDIRTGRAWDNMRHMGDRARAALDEFKKGTGG